MTNTKFTTRITKLLGVKYPIIQGGMAHVSEAKLAAAVSNAGGLGIIPSPDYPEPEDLRKEIQKAKELTDNPFGVNMSLFPAARPLPNEGYVEVCIDEGVAAVETSGVRAPEEFVEPLKDGGVKLIHKVAEVRHAEKAEEIGCDAVGVVGVECGGHPGLNNLTSIILVPLVADAVDIPVIAGGGIGDGRALAASLALGADGVVIGTRFMATKECKISQKFKKKLLESRETDTDIIIQSIRMNTRVLKNEAMSKVQEVEKEFERSEREVPLEEKLEKLIPLISRDKVEEVFHEGRLDAGIAPCGQIVGSIDEIVSVKELIDNIAKEAEEAISSLSTIATLNP